MSKLISTIVSDTLFLFNIADGSVPDASVISKFAHLENLTTDLTDVWDEGDPADAGFYPYPVSSTQVTVSSASALDTHTTGTGARTIKIYGLDDSKKEVSEILSLTGQAPVTSVNSYYRVHRAKIITTGTLGWNAGHVYIGTGTVVAGVPPVVLARITYDTKAAAGENSTLMSQFTVPTGKVAFLRRFWFNISKQNEAEVWLKARPEGECFQTTLRLMRKQGSEQHVMDGVIVFSAGTDIVVRAQRTGAANTDIACGYDLFLLPV